MKDWSTSGSDGYRSAGKTSLPLVCDAAKNCPVSNGCAGFSGTFSLKSPMPARLPDVFCWDEHYPTVFWMYIVKCKPVANAVRAMIGGWQTFQMIHMAVSLSRLRTYLQRATCARWTLARSVLCRGMAATGRFWRCEGHLFCIFRCLRGGCVLE